MREAAEDFGLALKQPGFLLVAGMPEAFQGDQFALHNARDACRHTARLIDAAFRAVTN